MNSKQRRKTHRRPSDLVERRASLDAKVNDADTFRVTISTDSPVAGVLSEREVLSHDVKSVDLSRVKERGLAVTLGHDVNAVPVGRVDELDVSDGRLTGRMRLSRNHQYLAADIDDGIITDGSVGARVARSAWKERGEDLVATRWTPVHFALVAAGADPAAQVSRTEDTMSDHHQADEANTTRAQDISALFVGLDGPEWMRMELDALRGEETVDAVSRKVNTRLRELVSSVELPKGGARIEGGVDELDSWLDNAELQLAFRADLVKDSERDDVLGRLMDAGMADLSLGELAREYARIRRLPLSGNRDHLIGRALNVAPVKRNAFSHTTSDFTNLLAATADKSIARGYSENEETFRVWVRNESLSNFRSHSFPALSSFSDLAVVPESGEITHGTFSDKAESMQLSTYGRLFGLGRQMVRNDDINMLGRLPTAMGRAASRQVGDLVYTVLQDTSTTLNETGRVLFNTTDGNLASVGAAIATGTLDSGRVAMRTRTAPAPGDGSAGATLNTVPRFLIVPPSAETTARVQIASELDPDEGTTTSFMAANPFRNSLNVVAEARLSGNAWYLAAGPNADVETISVGWLNGVQRPFLDTQSGFETDGIVYKVRIDCDAAALDWRGLYKNPGA